MAATSGASLRGAPATPPGSDCHPVGLAQRFGAGGRTDDDATTSATAVTAPALSVFGGGSNDGGVLATPSVAAAAFVSDHSTLERGAKRFRAASFATEM